MEGLVRDLDELQSFWQGKKVFLTGHTGFKGSWLGLWLTSLGAQVKGYALRPESEFNFFDRVQVNDCFMSQIGDIRNLGNLKGSMADFMPDIVIHMAAQPLVRASYGDPIVTFETNVMGTANLLEAVKGTSTVKATVVVTTDKCYQNNEWIWGYRENEPLGGDDPYSSSKACAELVTHSYRKSFFEAAGVGLATARAGNVIGGGDWSEDRLIPDILRAVSAKSTVKIRSPGATRPWQYVLDPLHGYLLLAERLFNEPHRYSSAWNFGPESDGVKTVDWILQYLKVRLPKLEWVDDLGAKPHEANALRLDISKSKEQLGWTPVTKLSDALDKICDFHEGWNSNLDIEKMCLDEINKFSAELLRRG